MDLVGIEPTTSSMPWKRAPSCATGPQVGSSFIVAERGAIVNATRKAAVNRSSQRLYFSFYGTIYRNLRLTQKNDGKIFITPHMATGTANQSLPQGPQTDAARATRVRSGQRGVSFKEPAMIALETLRTHKLRSFLTLLGVILSVATLIVVVSMVKGANRYVADKAANFGSNVFLVMRFPIITSAEEFVKLKLAALSAT